MIRHSLLVGAVALGFPLLVARAGAPCEAEAAAAKGANDPALAAPTEPDAIAHMRAGNAHSMEGNKRAALVGDASQAAKAAAEFKAAANEYAAAWMISSTPSILFNLAQTYRAAGDYKNAIDQYRRFLAFGRPVPPVRKLVECQIAAMTAELERAASTAPPRGPVSDEPPAPNEPPAPTPPTIVREVAPPAAPPWHADAIGWGVAGSGAVVAGIGGYLLLDASGLRADAKAEPREDVRTELDARADSRQRWGTITTVAGAAILAVGIVKLAITPDAPRAPRAQVSLQIAPGGFVIGGSF